MSDLTFEVGTQVVYPAHGVGLIRGIESQTIGGHELTTYVVDFIRDKMVLRIPVNRALKSGLRPICTQNELEKVEKTITGKARTSRGMWSRRAKEYETKINSGNILSLAEVVRDLHKNVDDPDRSYSERLIYESALDRLSGEVAAVRDIEIDEAEKSLVKTIADSQAKSEDVVDLAKVKAIAKTRASEFDPEFDEVEDEAQVA